jgi:hypothetical protein
MEIFNHFANEFLKYTQNLSIHIPADLSFRGIKEIKNQVPDSPGIYAIFYKNNKKCLYVGSSTNSIRNRLAMHYGKDAMSDYRGQLGKLRNPDNFGYWFYEVVSPTALDKQGFKCLVTVIEAMCSTAWNPEVQFKKF